MSSIQNEHEAASIEVVTCVWFGASVELDEPLALGDSVALAGSGVAVGLVVTDTGTAKSVAFARLAVSGKPVTLEEPAPSVALTARPTLWTDCWLSSRSRSRPRRNGPAVTRPTRHSSDNRDFMISE